MIEPIQVLIDPACAYLDKKHSLYDPKTSILQELEEYNFPISYEGHTVHATKSMVSSPRLNEERISLARRDGFFIPDRKRIIVSVSSVPTLSLSVDSLCFEPPCDERAFFPKNFLTHLYFDTATLKRRDA